LIFATAAAATTILRPFAETIQVNQCQKKHSPTHKHWSSIILYLLPLCTMIH